METIIILVIGLFLCVLLLVTLATILLNLFEFINLQFELFQFTYIYFTALLNGERPPKFRKIGWFISLVESLKPREIELLNQYCPYYSKLDIESKRKFERRLIRFKYEKDFYYTKESEKNKELMILLICAFAIQLTFCFKKYRLNYFRQINIHKHSFSLENMFWIRLSGFTCGTLGYIAFSETAFLKSIEYPTDGFNVALHEFAHAIDLCSKVNEQIFDINIQNEWHQHAAIAWDKFQSSDNTLLPEYAKKDMDEFYACCVERFFEVPDEMKKSMPDTFEILVRLFNQNPLNIGQAIHPY